MVQVPPQGIAVLDIRRGGMGVAAYDESGSINAALQERWHEQSRIAYLVRQIAAILPGLPSDRWERCQVMTPTQIHALDEMARIAASPELYLDMSIGEGDIQFLNNRTIMHGRTDYDDPPDIARRRHMLRLRLQMPTWPALPADQGMQSPADYPLWLRQRTPFIEVPTRYLAEMTRRKAEVAA